MRTQTEWIAQRLAQPDERIWRDCRVGAGRSDWVGDQERRTVVADHVGGPDDDVRNEDDERPIRDGSRRRLTLRKPSRTLPSPSLEAIP